MHYGYCNHIILFYIKMLAVKPLPSFINRLYLTFSDVEYKPIIVVSAVTVRFQQELKSSDWSHKYRYLMVYIAQYTVL